MGEMSDDLNKHCSAHSLATGFEVKSKKDTVRDCLSAFPYIWVSIGSFNLWYMDG